MEITTKQAQAITGWSNAYVVRLLHQGRFRGRKLGRDWLINEASLRAFMKLDRPAHRPKKKEQRK